MHFNSDSLRRCLAGWLVAGMCLLLLVGGAVRADGDPPDKQPIPAAAALAEAQQTVKEVFKEELAKAKKPEERWALAKRLLQAGTDEQGSSAARFALLSLARDTATEAGDAQTAFAAAEGLERNFQLDGPSVRRRLALSLTKTLRQAEQRKVFAQAIDTLIGQVIDADHYDQAKLLTDAALTNARALSDTAVLKQVVARVGQVRESETAFADVKKAIGVLEKSPSDPEANAKVGRFKCLVKGDFERGLPLLALSNDPTLGPLAEAEIKGVNTPAEQVKLADGWWDFAEKSTGTAKTRVQQRAGHWYVAALDGLEKGLLREKVEKRLKQIPAQAGAEAITAGPSGKGPAAFRLEDLSRYERLTISRAWERTKPRTTLAAQRVTDTLVLKSQNSPYLVTGLLVIEPGGKLLIEPGTVVLIAPGITLENEGTITMTSDGPWIVLAAAEAGKRWKGINSSGTITAQHCLLEGAEIAVEIHNHINGGSFSSCIFGNCGYGLSVGNGGSATTQDSLYLRNETALYGHGDSGKVTFSRCLVLFNGRGCSGNFYGTIDGSNSTLYGNSVGVEAAERGNFVRVRLSNVLGKTLTGTRGGKAQLAGNYWGKEGPGDPKGNDVSGPLPAPVKEAMPNLSGAEYLSYK